jgi:uncharacterized protein YcbK (DUF882 family)
MIKLEEILMGRDTKYPQDFTPEVKANIKVLYEKINIIREKYGKPMSVSSGWRPQAINDATSNAAKKSKHIVGLAIDIKDTDSKLWKWCMENLELLQELGLYLEDKRWTPTWVHFQIGPPASGLRIFRPSRAAATAPELWNGNYDQKYNKV